MTLGSTRNIRNRAIKAAAVCAAVVTITVAKNCPGGRVDDDAATLPLLRCTAVTAARFLL
jgi:hypothetical protein